jgi:hypothetical protein
MPMGSAPLQTRLRHTSAMAIAPPVNGSSSHMRPLQSTANARNFSTVLPPSFSHLARTRTTAASEPGRTTVPPRTIWSYCRHTQAREPTFGDPRSASSSAPRSRRDGGCSRLEPAIGAGLRRRRGAVVDGRVVGQHADGDVAHDDGRRFDGARSGSSGS